MISDAQMLDMIRRRTKGQPSREIGALYGMKIKQVLAHTNNVMQADLAESGEEPNEVRAAYWPPSKMARRG